MIDSFTQFSCSYVTKNKLIRVILLFNYKYDYNILSVHEMKQIKNAAKNQSWIILEQNWYTASTRSSIC